MCANATAKLIIISEHNRSVMTFEEVYLKYKNLLRKKAYSWGQTYDFDEMFQVASIALWKAFDKYDADASPIPFGVIVATSVKFALLAYHQKQRPKFTQKTSRIRSMVSLQDIVFESKGEGVQLEDLIGEPETYTEETVDRIVLEKLFKKFTKQQQQDIMNYVNGFKFKELAESKNIASYTVSTRMQNAFTKFRSLYLKEMVM